MGTNKQKGGDAYIIQLGGQLTIICSRPFLSKEH